MISIAYFWGVMGVAGVAGVAIALLRLLREVGKDVESVDRRKGVGRKGSYTKIGSRNRGLVADRVT